GQRKGRRRRSRLPDLPATGKTSQPPGAVGARLTARRRGAHCPGREEDTSIRGRRSGRQQRARGGSSGWTLSRVFNQVGGGLAAVACVSSVAERLLGWHVLFDSDLVEHRYGQSPC